MDERDDERSGAPEPAGVTGDNGGQQEAPDAPPPGAPLVMGPGPRPQDAPPPSSLPLMPLSMPPFAVAEPTLAEPTLAEPTVAEPFMVEPLIVQPLLPEPGAADATAGPSGAAWYPSGVGAYTTVPPPPEPPRREHKVFAVAAVAALVAGGLGAGLGVAFGSSSPVASTSTHSRVPVIPTPAKSTQASSGPSESVAAIARAALPAIVDIDTHIASATSTGQEEAAGTGMIITSSGEVLTNNHVVEDATKITVSVQGHAGTYAAGVIGVDPTKDVALLQIEGFSGPLPTIRLGNSSAATLGSSVVAMGNAQGLGGQPTTVTGIVSALDRTITASDESQLAPSETLHGLIETDAPIQPGDSGGPLLDSKGEVVGMDTAASSSSDSGATLGFAIPIDNARSIVQEMEKGETAGGIILGESPFLGIFESGSGSSVLPGGFFGGGFGGSGSAPVTGVAVSDVAIGSPAQSAGIVGGDTITKINSTSTPTIAALQKVVAADKPGTQVTVTFVDTSGVTQTATVTLAGIPK